MKSLCALLLVFFASVVQADTGRNPDELSRTLQSAIVYLPNGSGKSRQSRFSELPAYLDAHPRVGIVIYAHGCVGITHIDHNAGKFLAAEGYVFIAPDGFARKIKPASCRPLLQKGGLHREVLTWRHAEIDHALRHIRMLAGSANPVALVGHSEGGITVATLRTIPVRARVIEGWTCNAGWPEYNGINAPASEPVLSLVGENDRWFQHPDLRGNCEAFMDQNDRSIVFRKPDVLHNNHWLTSKKRVRRIVAGFLDRHM